MQIKHQISAHGSETPLQFFIVIFLAAIESCKQQLGTNEYNFHGQSECSEQTSTEGPVLEEFIPLKRTSSSDDEEEQSHKNNNKDSKNNDKAASSKKSDWLRSVQLWNQTPDPPAKEVPLFNFSIWDFVFLKKKKKKKPLWVFFRNQQEKFELWK